MVKGSVAADGFRKAGACAIPDEQQDLPEESVRPPHVAHVAGTRTLMLTPPASHTGALSCRCHDSRCHWEGGVRMWVD